MVITIELVLAVFSAIVLTSSAFAVVEKAVLKPRRRLAEIEMKEDLLEEVRAIVQSQIESSNERNESLKKDVAELKKMVENQIKIQQMTTRALVTMADEISSEGKTNGLTKKSIEKIKDTAILD